MAAKTKVVKAKGKKKTDTAKRVRTVTSIGVTHETMTKLKKFRPDQSYEKTILELLGKKGV